MKKSEPAEEKKESPAEDAEEDRASPEEKRKRRRKEDVIIGNNNLSGMWSKVERGELENGRKKPRKFGKLSKLQ